ncbi:MAG TPA: c-type cytochrome [Casimicrobiaceae bacterium]|nr:c-type cytochrome [Casimicrobiaceae bacterium]
MQGALDGTGIAVRNGDEQLQIGGERIAIGQRTGAGRSQQSQGDKPGAQQRGWPQAPQRKEGLSLAQRFSKHKPGPTSVRPDSAKVAAGKKKADEALCSMCHLGGLTGQNEVPRLAGQHYAYIKKQLEDFRAKRRTNDAGNMTSVASTLTDVDIENLAQYIASLY